MLQETGKTRGDKLATVIARRTGLIKSGDTPGAIQHSVDFTKSFIGTTGYILPGTATVVLNALDGISPVLAYQLPMAFADLVGQAFIFGAEKARQRGNEYRASLYRELQLGSQAVAAYVGAAAGAVELAIGAQETPESALLSFLTAGWIGALAVREFREERLMTIQPGDTSEARNLGVLTTVIQSGVIEAGITGAAAVIGSQIPNIGSLGAMAAGGIVGSVYSMKTLEERRYRKKDVVTMHKRQADSRDVMWRIEQGEPNVIDAT